ncbi:MAG: hypothetical protein NDF55_03615 [archaeon GB-1867-005]|nr:hypothetical protein [Candidatus Culexmicrobium cathedralense]
MEKLILICVAITIAFAVGSKVILSPGIPILAEQVEVYDEEHFLKATQVWDDQIGITSIADVPKYYLYHIIYFLSKAMGFEVAIKLFLILIHPVSFLTSYYFLKKTLLEKNRVTTLIVFLLILISLVYTFNPWITHRSRNLVLRWQYALSPLLFYLWIKILEDKRYLRYSFVFAIFFSLVETSRYIFKFLLPASLLAIFYIIFNRKVKIVVKRLLMTTAFLGSMLLPVYLPLLLTSLTNQPTVIQAFTVSNISGERPINAFSLFFTNYLGSHFSNPYPPSDKRPFLSLSITILALSSIIFMNSIIRMMRPSSWVIISFPVLIPITLYLSMLKEAPLSNYLINLMGNFPSLGRLIRQSYHNAMFLPLYYEVLLASLIVLVYEKIYNGKNKKKIMQIVLGILCFIILFSALVSSWPLLTGNLNCYWSPTTVPKDYTYVNKLIKAENPFFHALWLPIFGGRKAVWINGSSPYSGPPTGRFDLKSSSLPTYLYTKFYFFDYYNPIGWRPFYRPLDGYKDLRWGNIFGPLNIKYLIIHYDLTWNEYEEKINYTNLYIKSIVNKLRNDRTLKVIYEGEYLTVFQIQNVFQRIFIPNTTSIVVGGLPAYASLVNVIYTSESNVRVSIIFLNSLDIKSIKDFHHIFDHTIIVGNSSIVPLILAKLDKKIVIQPAAFVKRIVTPERMWSYGYSTSSYSFQSTLKKLGINEWAWDFDYGYGLAFTRAKHNIPSNLKLSNRDLIKSWEYNSQDDCLPWIENTPSKQFNALQKLICVDGILEVELYNSTWGWKTINTPLILVDPQHAYQFVVKIRGVNAHKIHIKIAEFDSNKKKIDVEHVKNVGDGTFDWKEVVFNYVPSSSRVRYVQLQIWHGHLTVKPLPNIIMIDYVKVYDVTKNVRRVTLDMPFDVSRSGKYKLFARYFENQKGGAIRVYLDGRLIAEISTISQLNRFVWRDLGTFKLEAGRHVLMLENVEGFNAFNVFVLIPVDEYSKLVKEFERLLENKTVIYIFEAESDMFRAEAKIVKNINASNGEALSIEPGGYAWQSFEVVKDGYYMVAIKLRGDAKVVIDEKSYEVSSNAIDFHYIGPIHLEKGNHTIRVEASKKSLYLDVIWIYSVESPTSRTTIEDLFKVKEELAKVIRYERIDPTMWKVKVIAKKPFMLVFAEAYDPLWEAMVYRDGELLEGVRSIPVYGVINGFWINETGDLTIVIRYVPQDWFELGLKISATTFALCIFYLVWDWRRSRGDRWALALRKYVGRVLVRS